MDIDVAQLSSGDRLIFSVGGVRQVWTVSAVNNQILKYFDANKRYGQMSLLHLKELMKNQQLEIEIGNRGQE